MDILAHTLWTATAAKAINARYLGPRKKPLLRIWQAGMWGVLPDLFAFTIPFIALALSLISGERTFGELPNPEAGDPPENLPLNALAHTLYNISHSAVIFILAFGIVWYFAKRPVWEMSGWLLHILIDLPTHTIEFYPTPIAWPLADWKVNGIPWSTPWLFIATYAGLIIAYLILRRQNRTNVQ